MKLIKFSFYYIASYLFVAAVGFLIFPETFPKLLLSNHVYEPAALRLAGMFALLLSIVVLQLGRKGLFELYRTTLFIRLIALILIIVFYFQTRDPFFFSMFAIVGVGVVLTLVGHFQKK